MIPINNALTLQVIDHVDIFYMTLKKKMYRINLTVAWARFEKNISLHVMCFSVSLF